MSLPLEFGRSLGGGSGSALSISQLSLHLAMLVREDIILQDVWIRGEISNLTCAASGHLYFSLKDSEACVSCVVWRSAVRRLRFRPRAGMQVVAHGSLDIYPSRGQYQLVLDELQPDGAGALHQGLEQAKARLLAEGLLDADRKRPLPAFPSAVAVVTSVQGAAVRDMCVTLRRGLIPPEIHLIPATVQGPGAEESLCAALEAAQRTGADLIIIGRGGGSLEDLWAFNSEDVARAIAASSVPVVSAVGHETDYTLADMAADYRAPTPTAAAELVTAHRDEMIRRAAGATVRAAELFQARVEAARFRYDSLSRRAAFAHPLAVVERRRERLDDLEARLHRSRELLLERWRHRLALAAGKLDGLSPLATLARGYASVRRLPELSPLTTAGDVQVGDCVRVRLADGTFDSRVTAVSCEDQNG